MSRALLIPTLVALTLAMGAMPAGAKTDPAGAMPEEDAQTAPDVIREKLTAQGYKDITVMPTSYAVSATDSDGKPVLLLIGPRSTTPMQEQAETPPAPTKEELIQR